MSNWIKVKDQRPPIGLKVLTYKKGHGIILRSYKKSNFRNKYGEYATWSCETYEPTHWTYLPEEPVFYDFGRPKKVKKCFVCDRYFSTTAPNAKYCSPERQQKAVRMKRKEWYAENEHYYRDYMRKRRAKEKEDEQN